MQNKQTFTTKYSVIVLLDEDSDGFAEYIDTLDKIFSSTQESYEIIIIANGKEGVLRQELAKINTRGKMNTFALNKKTSQAICLNAAFKESCGEIFVICGSYQQLTHDSMKHLLNSLDNETDIISPWRQKRVDSGFSQLQSKVFNSLTKKIAGTNLHDLSCTVKIIRRKVLEDMPLYGNMFRFLPVIANQIGFNTKEVPCDHYQERGRAGFYSLPEYIGRIIDIFTLFFNTRFARKPLRFFSILGALCMLLGLIAFFYVILQRIFFDHPLGGRPVLLMALLCMVLGVQMASTGLLGEIIAFIHGRLRKEYNIDKTI